VTGKQESLHTNDRPAALRLLHAKNEAVLQPAMNLQIAQVYLQHGDPALSRRTCSRHRLTLQQKLEKALNDFLK
jgi:hypothetical protein